MRPKLRLATVPVHSEQASTDANERVKCLQCPAEEDDVVKYKHAFSLHWHRHAQACVTVACSPHAIMILQILLFHCCAVGSLKHAMLLSFDHVFCTWQCLWKCILFPFMVTGAAAKAEMK